jgi:ribosomal-protein-alanine N-acetyltransferase
MATFATQRLRIESLRPDHAGVLFADLRDPALYAFIPDEPPDSQAVLAARFERMCAGAPAGRDETWCNWVMLDAFDDRPIGTLQATIDSLGSRASIAYCVVARRWREGFAREGVAWLLGHLAERGVATIVARIDTRNVASIRLVEALGFRRERTVAGADHFKGSASDEHIYVRLLRSQDGAST